MDASMLPGWVHQAYRWATTVLFFAMAMVGCDDIMVDDDSISGSDDRAVQSAEDCVIAAVHSDYVSTNVSLLHRDGTLCRDSMLHSGSAAPGLTSALSGDVSLARSPHPQGWLTLVDRYPNAVLTFWDPQRSEVASQLSVATGFASNPQDVCFVDPKKAYVSRFASNPTPRGGEAYDEGDDLLVIDHSVPEVTGRIDLSEWTDSVDQTPLLAMPTVMNMVDDRVWVVLNHMTASFDEGGDGLVLGIDPTTDSVVERLTIPGMRNCTAIAPTPSARGFWVACLGIFLAGQQAQLDHSGLVYVDFEEGEVQERYRLEAAVSVGQPIGFSLAAVDDERVVFVALGSLHDGSVPDRLFMADHETGEVVDLGVAIEAYELGDLLWQEDEQILLFASASPIAPRVQRYMWTTNTSLTMLEPVASNPSVGLPPRYLANMR